MPAFIITGMLRWSRENDFFIEADHGRGHWRLDVPRQLIGEVDRLVHDRVMAEGGRVGVATMAVRRIAAVDEAAAGVAVS